MCRTLLLSACLAAALPAAAQAPIGLAAHADGTTLAAPTTSWSRTAFELNPPTFPGDDDWSLDDAIVELVVTAPAGVTLGACDLTVSWDLGAFSLESIVANPAVFDASASNALPRLNGVRLTAARLGDNAITGPLATLATLRLRLVTAGGFRAWVSAVDCRAFDGVGGQSDVSVASGDTARVAALRGDFVARTGPSTLNLGRGDGTVDFDDLQVLIQAFGSSADPALPEHARYRLKFDIARRPDLGPGPDGVVDFEDLQALMSMYGLAAFLP